MSLRLGRARAYWSKTEQLVADVIAADGRVVFADDTARGGVNWRQRTFS